jgi:transcriptional regulator with XRE-family HTH domain
MSGKQRPLRATASGEIGLALVALIEQRGGSASDFARSIHCGRESLGRWIRNQARPSAKYAERICELSSDLRPLFERHGCFKRPERREPRVSTKPALSAKSIQRRTANRTAARKRSAKMSRLDRIKQRHHAMQRRVKLAEGRVLFRLAQHAEGRANDYVDILSESVAADVHVEEIR